jgi:hypothetical protein
MIVTGEALLIRGNNNNMEDNLTQMPISQNSIITE